MCRSFVETKEGPEISSDITKSAIKTACADGGTEAGGHRQRLWRGFHSDRFWPIWRQVSKRQESFHLLSKEPQSSNMSPEPAMCLVSSPLLFTSLPTSSYRAPHPKGAFLLPGVQDCLFFLSKPPCWGWPRGRVVKFAHSAAGGPVFHQFESWAWTWHCSSSHAEEASHMPQREGPTTEKLYNCVLGGFGEKKQEKKRRLATVVSSGANL